MIDTVAERAPGSQDDDIGALLMKGREVAVGIKQKCIEDISALKAKHGLLPGLAVVRLGDDSASLSYASRIEEAFGKAGLTVTIVALPATASRAMLQSELGRLNVLPEIAGVIVQQPMPPHIGLDAITDTLDPNKDVDGIHPVNIGRLSLGLDCFVPATPAGGIAMLDYYGIPIEGKQALVIGRSGVVGRPFAQLLLARNATVTIAHSRTRNLYDLVAGAEILASAVGKPHLIKGDMLRPGAAVIDFGAAMVDGQMTGDVDYRSALDRVAAITPVPGGTGPVTNAMLLKNTIKAIKRVMHDTSA
ncbi:MAG: bifunctional 5,10-methylenetetrahydrofolate dehydrogenase/5,10-methenyltetrahydrofolate cyclohydrolase [Chloroflexia bacterium]